MRPAEHGCGGSTARTEPNSIGAWATVKTRRRPGSSRSAPPRTPTSSSTRTTAPTLASSSAGCRPARAAHDDRRRQPRRRLAAGALARAGRGAGRPRGFNAPVSGPDGFTMPAMQHDALLWLAGAAYDVVFDEARARSRRWPRSRRSRRGLELALPPRPRPHRLHRRHGEPEPCAGARHRAGPSDAPGAGGSVLLLQRWTHDVAELGGAVDRGAGADHGPHESGLDRARGPPRGLPRGPYRPGRLRPHLPAQHALRHGHRPRHDVRRLRRRTGARSRGCSRAWPASTGPATHSLSTPSR